MGAVYNSSANIVYQIINWIGIIASAGCVAMIVLALIKIMIGDESDHTRYLKRIKNGIVALILILCSTQIVSLTTRYFAPGTSAGTSIGDFHEHIVTTSGQGLAKEIKDKENRKLIVIDNDIYVRTNKNVKKDLNGDWFNSYDVVVDVYKLYSDCQGFTSGSLADEKYYVFKWRKDSYSKMSANTEKWSQNFVFPANYRQVYGDIASDSDWDSMKNGYANDNSNYHPMWEDYSNENNPYR